MVETSARCALPGCDRTIELQPRGGPRPKYCSKEHSVEARRLRQRARADAALESAEPGDAEPSSRSSPTPRRNTERGRWLTRTGVAVVVLAAFGLVGPASVPGGDTPAPVATPYAAAPPTTTTTTTSSEAPPIELVDRPSVPVAPVGLTVTPGDGNVELCWQPVVGATAYVAYYRDVAKTEDWQRMPYPITDHCWMAGQLWNNHAYQFRLVASNSGGESGFSDVVQATPAEPKPGVPGGLSVSPGDGQVRLCWKPASNADMYVMYHRDVTTAERWTRAQYPVTNGLCWTAGLLTNSHLYQFRITAANSNGESAYSGVVQATPTATAVLPAVPTGLTATPDSGRVLLCWQPAARANAYVAYYRDTTAGQDWVTMPYPIQNATCWNADQLWNTHTYQFRLTASNNSGQSDFSAIVQATPR